MTKSLMGMGREQPMGMGMGMGMGESYDLPTLIVNKSENNDVYHYDQDEWKRSKYIREALRNLEYEKIQLPDFPVGEALKQEFEELKRKQEDPGLESRMDDILQEVYDFNPRFEKLCSFDQFSHPTTYQVMMIMTRIGWHIAIYFKEHFNRFRPSFLDPDIVPSIKIPTHPSYPSGHSTQAYLVALALCDIFEKRIRESEDFEIKLKGLGKEIGENREWAGVHYKSDTTTGQLLAQEIWGVVSKYKIFEDIINIAKGEWYENLTCEEATTKVKKLQRPV